MYKQSGNLAWLNVSVDVAQLATALVGTTWQKSSIWKKKQLTEKSNLLNKKFSEATNINLL